MNILDKAMNDYLSPKDFAIEFNLGYTRIIQLIHEGKIYAEKYGRDWYIHKSELERMQKATQGTSKDSSE